MQLIKEKFFWLLILDICSLCHVLSVFQKGESSDNDNKKTIKESQKGETSDNDNKKTTKESKKVLSNI